MNAKIFRVLENFASFDIVNKPEAMMDITPIQNDTAYRAALKEAESLMNAALDTPEGERLDAITKLIEEYEDKHFRKCFSQT